VSTPDAIVVGAGVSGLACARRLREAGLATLVLEASDGVGGRVRTDEIEGFRLDRGFQVLPTAYDEAKAMLDYQRLRLRRFERGAVVRRGGRFHHVADPRRSPLIALQALGSRLVTPRDALGVARLLRGSGGERTTREALADAGLSSAAADGFLAPFLRGIFLEGELSTTSRFLGFVLSTFSAGPAAVPERGMGEIAEQLAEGTDVRLDTPVARVSPRTVALAGGEELEARAVVVATARLLDDAPAGWNGVTCLYFDAPRAPLPGAWLVLDGEGAGPVNNLSVPTEVSPAYGPHGRALVSASVLGVGEPDEEAVRRQLAGWFGAIVRDWRLVRTYRIAHALPAWPVDVSLERPPRVEEGLYACGDHRTHPSLNGALRSGRLAAEAILADLA
jgi:glycine/D-amino acid oxidase-like deaminating enzyme